MISGRYSGVSRRMRNDVEEEERDEAHGECTDSQHKEEVGSIVGKSKGRNGYEEEGTEAEGR